MRKITVFNHISLDGYFSGANGDLSWAKGHKDPEMQAFTEENAKGGGTLLFGRRTYDMMAAFWPTPMAAKMDPVVADRMNQMKKYVASRTLEQAGWSNTTLLKGPLAEGIRGLKEADGNDITILGSGNLVAQLAEAGLIDEFQFLVNPVVLGQGRTLFEGVTRHLPLKLAGSRVFGSGNVLLRYRPE